MRQTKPSLLSASALSSARRETKPAIAGSSSGAFIRPMLICARCMVITYEEETAEIAKTAEPDISLRALRSPRFLLVVSLPASHRVCADRSRAGRADEQPDEAVEHGELAAIHDRPDAAGRVLREIRHRHLSGEDER